MVAVNNREPFKTNNLNINHEPTTMKKYVLKPGVHQFAPGSPPVHTNDNLTDEEAEWYLERYPHINALFDSSTVKGGVEEKITETAAITKRKIKRVDTLPYPSGGKESR